MTDTLPEAAAEKPTIHLMDDTLASRVAAGEVVERPASVIKELIENSIDAGAHSVRVEIIRGGVALIKVDDDGTGMSRADLALCAKNHATSKIEKFEDLYERRSMGFRGEAIPSIASVSHMTISTRRARDIEGSCIIFHGGEEEELRTAGCSPGTHIEVRELFYNTPARRQFLKSAETEAAHAEHQVRLHALAFPNMRFAFVQEGDVVFDVASTPNLRHRIAELFGQELAGKLLRLRPNHANGVQVTGYILPLSEARRNKRLQYIFLNGRPIEDKNILRAIRDGFGGFPTGLHPGFFLYLDIEPALVDVNVHPAKREVRFRRLSDVISAVIDSVAGTLAEHARAEHSSASDASPSAPPAPEQPVPHVEPAPHHDSEAPPVASHRLSETPKQEPPPDAFLPPLRLVIEPEQQELKLPPSQRTPHSAAKEDSSNFPFHFWGILPDRFAVFENSEGLVVLSVTSARERIIFESLVEQNKRPVMTQQLLTPAFVELDARDAAVVKELLPLFARAGFRVALFGAKTLRVEGIPSLLKLREIDSFVADMIGSFSAGEVRLKRSRNPFELFAGRMATACARRENISAWLENPVPLLRELLRCDIPYCTPSGKPTMIPLPISELKRRFQAL